MTRTPSAAARRTHRGHTAVLIGVLLTVPTRSFASACWSELQSAPARAPTALVATHATRGVVKSVDATTLVITRSAAGRKEMAFALNPATQHEGCIAVGSAVEVRYRAGQKQQVATAVRVQDGRNDD